MAKPGRKKLEFLSEEVDRIWIRLSRDTYEWVKQEAKINYRTVMGQIAYIVDKAKEQSTLPQQPEDEQ